MSLTHEPSGDEIAALLRAADPPPGFTLMTGRGGFTTRTGPWFGRTLEDGTLRRGFRVMRHHLNALGIIHGGLLSAFLDTTMGSEVYRATRRRAVTLRLQADFLGNTRMGDWVEGVATCTGHDEDVAYVGARIYGRRGDLMTGQGLFALLKSGHPIHERRAMPAPKDTRTDKE